MRSHFKIMLIAALLGGCGFHLQGRQSLPPVLAAVQIDPVDSQSDFYLGLRSALRASGSQLYDEAAPVGSGTARPVIHIINDGITESVLTVTARNVQTAFQLNYTIRISVTQGDRELMPAEAHILSREYSFDAAALLAKERERETLAAALADDLVTLVMRRLSSL
jgi:LPS-assembly lipoprotein